MSSNLFDPVDKRPGKWLGQSFKWTTIVKYLADQFFMRSLGAKTLCSIVLLFGLNACSGLPGSYPSVADIDRISQKILTPDERKKAIEDMTLENDQLRAKTIASIEKR